MAGSLLGFVWGSTASLPSGSSGARSPRAHGQESCSARVGRKGWFTDTERAVLLGGSSFPPNSLATVGNGVSSNSN